MNKKRRPVKVCFASEFDKRRFYANLHLLKNAEEKYKRVQVQHDVSKEERDVIKKLVDEAKEKNKEEKPKDFLHKVRGFTGSMNIVKVYMKQQGQQ